jgi:O-antigen/teichoic acid export membrane protein
MGICLLLSYPSVVVACMAVGCLWILLMTISTTLGDLLQSLEHFGTYSAASLVSGFVVTGASIFVAHRGYGPFGLAVAYLTAPLVSVAICWCQVNRYVPVRIRWNSTRAIALLRESRFVGLNSLATTIRARVEQFLVPKLVGLEAFGLFSAGTVVPDRLGNIPDAVGTAFYPRIAHAARGTVAHTADEPVTNMITIGIAVSLPLVFVGMFLAPSLAGILVPDSVDAVQGILQVAVWSLALLPLSIGMSYALQAVGHQNAAASAGLRSTAVGVVLSVILVVSFGVIGAAWSFLLRPTLLSVLLIGPFSRVFPTMFSSLPLGRILLSASVLCGVFFIGNRQPLWPALGFTGLGLVAYGLALLVTRVVDLSTIRRLITRIPAT